MLRHKLCLTENVAHNPIWAILKPSSQLLRKITRDRIPLLLRLKHILICTYFLGNLQKKATILDRVSNDFVRVRGVM